MYLKGGLGNQMFQYAFGRAESLQKDTSLKLDLSDLLFPLLFRSKETPRTYKLDHFNIKAEVITPKRRPLIRQLVRKAYEKIIKKERNFQSEKYFKEYEDIIRADFSLKESLSEKAAFMEEQIHSSSSPVSVHVRRGDYITDIATALYHGALPLSYYEASMKEMNNRIPDATFIIFSDDIEWAKENLPVSQHAIFVSDKTLQDYEELILMSKCMHHIIANSSFSWWGAWLNANEGKMVIAPKRWFATQTADASVMMPAEWMRI